MSLGIDDVVIVTPHHQSQEAFAERVYVTGATNLTFDKLIPT